MVIDRIEIMRMAKVRQGFPSMGGNIKLFVPFVLCSNNTIWDDVAGSEQTDIR